MALFSVGIAALASCARVTADENNTALPLEMPALHPVNLADTHWVLVSYGDPASPIHALPATRVILAWNSSVETVSGNAGCNLYGGKCQVRDGMLAFSDIYTTKMWSTVPGVMEQEGTYLSFLQKAQAWSVENGVLTIQSQNGQVLVFATA